MAAASWHYAVNENVHTEQCVAVECERAANTLWSLCLSMSTCMAMAEMHQGPPGCLQPRFEGGLPLAFWHTPMSSGLQNG